VAACSSPGILSLLEGEDMLKSSITIKVTLAFRFFHSAGMIGLS
jgi:hypothetical protein